MDPAVVPPSGDAFVDFDDIQPVSWADSIDDTEYEALTLDVVIPSWAVLDFPMVKTEDPNASPPAQRRAENAESFVRREFRQKTESKVWRKPAPSSSWRRSPPSGLNKMPERPVREASPTQRRSPPSGYFPRQQRPVREASPTRRRSPPSGFIKRPERPVREASPTRRRSPPSWYCHRQECRVKDASPAQQRSPPSGFFKRSERTEVEASPQSRSPCSGFFNRQERPVKEASPQEKSPPSGSLKKRRPSLALYSPPQCRSPASGSPPSGVFKRPEPAVTESSPSQTQGPSTNGVSSRDGQNTTPAKSVAQKQEMGGPEMSSIPPTTHTPAPVSEDKSPHSGFFKKPLTEAAPLRPRRHPSGFFKRPEPAVTESSPSRHRGPLQGSSGNGVCLQDGQNTTLAVAQKQEMGGPENSSKPLTTPTPTPVYEHTSPSGLFKKLRAPLTEAPPLHRRPHPSGFFKRPDPPVTKASSQHQNASTSSSSTVNGVRPREGQNTTAKTFPQRQGVGSSLRTACSVDELCKMLDALHLSEKPTSCTTPNRPNPPIRPATFVFQEQPTFAGFAQHQTVAGRKTWTKTPAPPTPDPAPQHLPAPYPNPRPCLLDKKLCRKRPRLSSDS